MCYAKIMEPLVGKTVSTVELSDDAEFLRLTTTDGERHTFRTEGDCCSYTWINDLIGVSSLIGHEITAVESVDLPAPEITVTQPDGYDSDILADYGYKFRTTGGYFDIIYRNSSNGYYGGSLERDDSDSTQAQQLCRATYRCSQSHASSGPSRRR